MEHLTTEELEAFVTGEMGADLDRVREHVRRCAGCARRLAAESRLDTAMRTAAGRMARGGSASVSGWAPAWLRRPEAIAIAAGLLAISLGTLWWSRPPRLDSIPATRVLSIPPDRDTPGLRARNEFGPGFEVFPAADAFRDTGSEAPGMRARWDSLGGASGVASSQRSGSGRSEPSEP